VDFTQSFRFPNLFGACLAVAGTAMTYLARFAGLLLGGSLKHSLGMA